jgi:hypothetical protein
MSNAPLAIRQKTEAFFQAYLKSRILAVPGTFMDGVGIILRQQITTRAFPRVVIEAARAPADENMNELYRVDLKIYLGTHSSEPDAVNRHAIRTGLISEWMADRAAIKAFNTDAANPVSSLSVLDCLLEDEEGEQTGEHWIEVLGYMVPAQITGNT